MHAPKKHILVVDDDPVILRIYQDGLWHRGFKVTTASDGVVAMQALRQTRPDLLVLDLMMPKLSGVDVLKFLRADASFASLPIIVLSNAFMNEMALEATKLGVQKALLKIRCSPNKLAGVIEDVLAGRDSPEDPNQLLVHPTARPAVAAEIAQADAAPGVSAPGTDAPGPWPQPPAPVAPENPPAAKDPQETEIALRAKVRRDFLAHGPETVAALRALCDSLAAAGSEMERGLRLNNFFRKIHFLVAAAGMAECPEISHLASVFEALLYELIAKPQAINASVLRTCYQTIELFPVLFRRAAEWLPVQERSIQVLAVDDDPVCNRLVVSALRHAQLHARSVEQAQHVLPMLKETKYDLILLDIEMPDISGFELCRLIRRLPGYAKTPVVYVTSHDDFASRQSSIASGGDDLISKPILPLELAVKVVTHLLQRQA